MPLRLLDLPPVSRSETLAGTPGVVDLWCFSYEDVCDPGLLAAQSRLMSVAERTLHDGLVFEKDRRLFRATRALVRTVLGEYANVRPEEWAFAHGPHGKPFVVRPLVTPLLHFNVSNTPGLVVCLVSVAHEPIGVDAECVDRHGEYVAIANEYFSTNEIRALRALPPAEQSRRFVAYWTLKESYLKARGLGLALPLNQISFQLDEGDHVGVTFDPQLVDDRTRWRFALLDALPRHLVAVGVATGAAPLSLRAVSYVPLRGVVSWVGPSCSTTSALFCRSRTSEGHAPSMKR